MTPTQLKVKAWQAAQPAFTGPVTAAPLGGKASRKNAKARLVKKAGGK